MDIRPYQEADEPAVIAVWREVLLDAVPHNETGQAGRNGLSSGICFSSRPSRQGACHRRCHDCNWHVTTGGRRTLSDHSDRHRAVLMQRLTCYTGADLSPNAISDGPCVAAHVRCLG